MGHLWKLRQNAINVSINPNSIFHGSSVDFWDNNDVEDDGSARGSSLFLCFLWKEALENKSRSNKKTALPEDSPYNNIQAKCLIWEPKNKSYLWLMDSLKDIKERSITDMWKHSEQKYFFLESAWREKNHLSCDLSTSEFWFTDQQMFVETINESKHNNQSFSNGF